MDGIRAELCSLTFTHTHNNTFCQKKERLAQRMRAHTHITTHSDVQTKGTIDAQWQRFKESLKNKRRYTHTLSLSHSHTHSHTHSLPQTHSLFISLPQSDYIPSQKPLLYHPSCTRYTQHIHTHTSLDTHTHTLLCICMPCFLA